ncbi:MAG: ABC transporter permease [Spirochaetales bacterium]|nr:ABC transporter permease [Spirochaetales bacterium]
MRKGFIISLAFKNLFRYTRRTIITSIAIAVGIAFFIWIDGWMKGIEKESERNTIQYETGSAQIMDRTYWDERDFLPLRFTLNHPDSMLEVLKENNIPATKRITFSAEVYFGDVSKQIKCIGINPETDNAVFNFKDEKVLLPSSRYLRANRDEIMIGRDLAENLGIDLDAFITADSETGTRPEAELKFRTRLGAYQTLTVKVVAVYNTPNPVINKAIGMIPLDIASSVLEMNGSVTEIAMLFPPWEDVNERIKGVAALFANTKDDLTVMDWKNLSGNPNIMEGKSKFLNIFLFLIFVIAAVGISNTLLMAVFERIREIGMMRALGMKDSSIRLAFLFESAGIGLIGSVVGLAIGAVLNYFMVTYGLDFTELMGSMDFGYRIYGVFRATWNPQTMVTAFLLGIISSIIISFLPSSRALKMEVTECLRYQ